MSETHVLDETGVVVKWIDARGFGFVKADDDPLNGDVFLHISQWAHETPPLVGTRVRFARGWRGDGKAHCVVAEVQS